MKPLPPKGLAHVVPTDDLTPYSNLPGKGNRRKYGPPQAKKRGKNWKKPNGQDDLTPRGNLPKGYME